MADPADRAAAAWSSSRRVCVVFSGAALLLVVIPISVWLLAVSQTNAHFDQVNRDAWAAQGRSAAEYEARIGHLIQELHAHRLSIPSFSLSAKEAQASHAQRTAAANRERAAARRLARGTLFVGGGGVGLLGGLTVVWMIAVEIAGWQLRQVLRARGFDWMTHNDAMWMVLVLGRRAWQAPWAQDFHVLPGSDKQIDLLVAVTRLRLRCQCEWLDNAIRQDPREG